MLVKNLGAFCVHTLCAPRPALTQYLITRNQTWFTQWARSVSPALTTWNLFMLCKWMQNNFLMLLCLLQSLPIPLRWKQTAGNQNYCGVCFPDTGNWNFRTSKSTHPSFYPSTKRTISSARCNPVCGQAPGASWTHGTFHSCLSRHCLWESSALLNCRM